MAIKMYDLAGAEPSRRFSPYCWRIKLSLKHKGLDFDTIPWCLTEKSAIAPYNSERVPVLIDDGRGIADSWTIANYLEDTYRDRLALFGSKQERALARFYNQWTDVTLHVAIFPIIVADILSHLDMRDRDYFRTSREARLGTPLEALTTRRESYLSTLQQVLEPLRQTLAAQPYLAGDTPRYADFIVFGAFQWARSISNVRLLQASDPIDSWRQRLLDAFDGFARAAPGYW
ncbi:MAG: glutathione S-transferase family protein [Deltaproteobacteria bacterium]|nr:glutathione S-transferase family protein [Deltaproteobacteria bacterium]MBV8454425.1 glutathione S-transferase family protein [Deltaproteobacteria bacterium]